MPSGNSSRAPFCGPTFYWQVEKLVRKNATWSRRKPEMLRLAPQIPKKNLFFSKKGMFFFEKKTAGKVCISATECARRKSVHLRDGVRTFLCLLCRGDARIFFCAYFVAEMHGFFCFFDHFFPKKGSLFSKKGKPFSVCKKLSGPVLWPDILLASGKTSAEKCYLESPSAEARNDRRTAVDKLLRSSPSCGKRLLRPMPN